MKFVFSIFIFLFLWSSCTSPRYYTPNVIVTPCFKKAGDYYFNGNTNIFNKGSGTLGYALTDRIGIYANLSGSSESNNNFILPPVTTYSSTAVYGGLGAGYYRFIQKNKNHGKGFELFSEFAYGHFNISAYTDPSYTSNPYKIEYRYYNGIMNRGSVIANFNKTYGNLQWINSMRFAVIKLYGSNGNFKEFDDGRLYYRKFYPAMEYGTTLLLGKRRLKFMSQYNLYYCVNSIETKGALQKFNFSMNFGFVVSPKWK